MELGSDIVVLVGWVKNLRYVVAVFSNSLIRGSTRFQRRCAT